MAGVFAKFLKDFSTNSAADFAATFLAFLTAVFCPADFFFLHAARLKKLFTEIPAEFLAEVVAKFFTEIFGIPMCAADFFTNPAANIVALFPTFGLAVGTDSP